MEIKRDTIMTSYFDSGNDIRRFFLSLQLIEHDILLKAPFFCRLSLLSLLVKPEQFDLIQWKWVTKLVKSRLYDMGKKVNHKKGMRK